MRLAKPCRTNSITVPYLGYRAERFVGCLGPLKSHSDRHFPIGQQMCRGGACVYMTVVWNAAPTCCVARVRPCGEHTTCCEYVSDYSSMRGCLELVLPFSASHVQWKCRDGMWKFNWATVNSRTESWESTKLYYLSYPLHVRLWAVFPDGTTALDSFF